MSTSEFRLAALAAAAAALMSAVVACSSTAPSADAQPGHDAFAQCLTEHGVSAPPQGQPPQGQLPQGAPPQGTPPQGGTPPAPPGVDQQTWDAALQACQSLAPAPPAQR
jgi:hypothetical protein